MEVIRNVIREMKRKYIESTEELKKRLEDELRLRFPGHEVHVLRAHELVECPYKRKYREEHPDYAFSILSKPRVILGELIDVGAKEVSGMKKDYVVNRSIKVDENMVIGIIGNINIYNEKDKEVIEVKFTNNLNGTPRIHHIEQVRLYLWLTRSVKGKLLYISPDGWREYFVSDVPDTEEVAKLAFRAVRFREPVPSWSWECRYCPFREVCPHFREGWGG